MVRALADPMASAKQKLIAYGGLRVRRCLIGGLVHQFKGSDR